MAKVFYFNKIELTNAPSCGIMFVLQKQSTIFRGVAKVTSKKQLIVVFYEVKPPKARSEPSRRLAQATDHDYATVAEGERHAICSSVIFFRGVAKVVSRQFRVQTTDFKLIFSENAETPWKHWLFWHSRLPKISQIFGLTTCLTTYGKSHIFHQIEV